MSRTARTLASAVLTVAALSSVATGAFGANRPEPTAPPTPAAASGSAAAVDLGSTSSTSVDPRAAAALAEARHITIAAATARLAKEKSLGDLGARLEGTLKGHTGGSYLGADGALVVTVTDSSAAAVAAASGAKAARVSHTAAALDAVMTTLNAHAKAHGAGSVQGWYVDVPANTVVVTLTEGAKDAGSQALVALARKAGSAVRFETASAAQAPHATEYLVGGYEFLQPSGNTCSVGFNTRDAAGRNVVLTAGHCTRSAGNATRNGYIIGANRTSNFPGSDFGTFWNSYPTYWQPTINVYNYTNGTFPVVKGSWANPPIGATVCKSGRTTGWTCGVITALNQSVVFSNVYQMYGLVRHNACVEGGDSGGSNLSAGNYALGLTSGASTTSGKCLSKVGQQNISWYQPIAPALNATGLKLVLS